MQNARMIGNLVKNLANERDFTSAFLAEQVGCNASQIDAFYDGRFILPFSKLKTLSDLFHISMANLLAGNQEMYNKTIVHCMKDFSDDANREKILDLIDDYLDIREALC